MGPLTPYRCCSGSTQRKACKVSGKSISILVENTSVMVASISLMYCISGQLVTYHLK